MSYTYDTYLIPGSVPQAHGLTTAQNASGVTTTTFTDPLGRTAKTESGATGTTTYEYYLTDDAAGTRGKLKSVTDGDNVTVSYDYNDEGDQNTTTRNVPNPDPNGDPYSLETTTTREVISDVTLHGVSLGTSICTTQTISSNGVAPVITSISYTSTGGLKSGSSSFGSHTVTEVTRPDSDGIAIRTSIHPDATRTVETRTHGLTTRVENQDASDDHNVISHVDYDYDVHQRLETVTDSRTGEAGRTTYSNFTESGDPLTTTQGTTAPNIRITSVAKDTLGRTIQTTLPDQSVTHTSYWPTGQVKARWGSQTNPVFHIYDEQNRLKELHTWQTAPALEQATVEPPDFSAKTQWIYGSTTGRLDRKQYADGKGTDYTYTAAGRIETRIWARAISVSNPTNVTTTYGYTHGFITSTVYNDGTPNLEYTYDNLGRQNTVKRGGVLHADYDYRSDTLALDKEMLQIDTLNKTLIRTYEDGTGGTLAGRPNGYTFTGGSATWGYDDAGRLSTVTDGTNTFTYGYRYVVSGALHEGSTAENSIRSAMPFTLSGPQVTTTLAYEATRHVLASRQNNLPGGTLSKFTYTVNPIGQRETVTTAGTAFGQNPANWIWGYDSLGQVISANSPTATSDRGYLYDSIGNRRGIRIGDVGVPTEPDGSIQANQGTLTYASNPLNQYSTVPQATAAPVFDFDGNMTSGPVPGAAGQTPGIHAPAGAQLTWDAENRLVKAVVAGTIINYAYDHLSRLISRSEGANPTTTTHYLYDGWNRIAQYQSNGTGHTLEKTYLWGMDLSGTMQGAGGVGGLLAEKQGANTYYPTYDGNGNVSEYVTGNGAKAAHFEYDPFGNLTVDSENNAATFPYRFSTKPQDPTTGLYFYTYRWYDPLTGRWPSRDPIEEQGGVNLYGFVGNDGVNSVDNLGLEVTKSDCNTQTIGIRIKDFDFSPRGVGLIGISGRSSLAFRGSRKECCKICSDGSKKSVFTFTGTLSFDAIIEVTGGPMVNLTTNGGNWGFKGRVGLYGSIEGRFEASGGWTWDQCERNLDFSVGGSILAEGKVGGGFQGGLYFGAGRSVEATGFLGGYASVRLGSKLKCDEGSCNIFVEQNSGEVGLTGQVGARLWKKNWTSRVNLGKVAVGTNETILNENFATPSDMKP